MVVHDSRIVKQSPRRQKDVMFATGPRLCSSLSPRKKHRKRGERHAHFSDAERISMNEEKKNRPTGDGAGARPSRPPRKWGKKKPAESRPAEDAASLPAPENAGAAGTKNAKKGGGKHNFATHAPRLNEKNGKNAAADIQKDPAPAPAKNTRGKKENGGKNSAHSAARNHPVRPAADAPGHPAAETVKKPAPARGKIQGKTPHSPKALKTPKKQAGAKLRVMSLGGLMEIGKNMTVIEYGRDIIVVDSGFAFPDEDMLGVDYVIPDITYLEQNADRVRGILITHGHEDHIGAIPYVLRKLNPPIYGTRLSLGIIKNKLSEHKLPNTPRLMTVEAGDVVQLGVFLCEFIHVNHSIADACAIAIRTPLGIVYHSGDFKLDVTPIDGNMMDLVRIGEIGREGVLLMLGESTNAERDGFSLSERRVGASLDRIFAENSDHRLVIATFSSNVHRVQQIINCSIKHGRRVAVLGRSMENVIGAAVELGYMDLPKNTLIDVGEIRRFRPEEITLITTGSQGEPMSALYRMAFDSHDRVKLTPSDTVVLSSSAIPGNELLVDRIINALIKNGIRVVSDATTANVHASGHACSEELKLLHALVRPRYFMPIHGEMRHLHAHREIAKFMGMPPENIFLSEIGDVLEIDENGARRNGTVPSGQVLVDGSGIGDVGAIVLRDRRHLSQDGLIVVVATVAMREKMVLSGPDIVSRGFVYVREAEDMMDEARRIAEASINRCFSKNACDWAELKSALRDDLSRFFFKKTKRSPMILPIVMDA